MTIAEVEEIVEVGDLNPEAIHVPSVYVQRVIKVPYLEKRIERVTLRLVLSDFKGSLQPMCRESSKRLIWKRE